MKTYRKLKDKLGPYYKCKSCLASSQDEAYIRSQVCHNPIIKTTSVIGKGVDETPLSPIKGGSKKDKAYIALIKLPSKENWRPISFQPSLENLLKHLSREVGGKEILDKKLFEVNLIEGTIQLI